MPRNSGFSYRVITIDVVTANPAIDRPTSIRLRFASIDNHRRCARRARPRGV